MPEKSIKKSTGPTPYCFISSLWPVEWLVNFFILLDECCSTVPEQFASVIGLSSPGLLGAEETYTDEEALLPVSSRQQEKKNCITPAYLLDQQFSGQKLLSSAGRNDLWSRTSGLRKWSCSFYLGELSPEMLSGSILLWFLPSKFKLLCPASYVVTPPSCQISMLWIFIKILGNSWLGPTFPHIYPFGWHTPFPYSWAPHWQPLRAFQ